MFRTQQGGRQTELRRRGVPLTTIITADNYGILLTQDSLITIANKVSDITGKKFTTSEVKELYDFITILPQGNFHKLTFEQAQSKIAKLFVRRDQQRQKLWEDNEDQSIANLARLDDPPRSASNMEFYQKKELMQLTDNENQYKLSAFSDRRGNAVVDRERVEGNLSSPNSVYPTGKLSKETLHNTTYTTMKLIESFLSADSVDNIFRKANQIWTTYQSVNLPHQTIQLDSRNRLLTHSQPNEYRWYIHAAGKPGRPGDVQIQDTLQQVITMKINSFWIPVIVSNSGYYNKVRLLIKEFSSQSINVTDYFNPADNLANIENYHWEFDIVEVIGNRMKLRTLEPLFTFRKPFARVETITFVFYTPYGVMTLFPDRGIYTVTYGNPTVYDLSGGSNNFLITGDLVYILNSDSGNSEIDLGLTDIQGYIITKITDTQFTIPFDSSALVGSDPGINIYYGSRRIFAQIEFTSLEQ